MGPYGAAALVVFIVAAVIAWLLSRSLWRTREQGTQEHRLYLDHAEADRRGTGSARQCRPTVPQPDLV
jgi:hypothetical protein